MNTGLRVVTQHQPNPGDAGYVATVYRGLQVVARMGGHATRRQAEEAGLAYAG